MAHGNTSDLAFLGVLAVVIQLLAFPDSLYTDFGPLKAQFSTRSADLDIITTLAAGVLLTIGMTFSGVKWNPINGKMGGFAGFIAVGVTAYYSLKADDFVFVPRFFYLYLAVLLLGTVHITIFPSNPLVKTVDPNTKNNHGNMSDMVSVALVAASLLILFYPEHLFMDIGPLKAQFTATSYAQLEHLSMDVGPLKAQFTATSAAQLKDLAFMNRFVGLIMLMWALILSGVKWNPINGKMAGVGGSFCSGYTTLSLFKKDKGVFVPQLIYVYALLIFLSALHIFVFPSNPLPTKPEGNDKKKA